MNLLEELSLRKISINECAKKTGIPYGALYPIIHGKIDLEKCQYSTLQKLADFFSCEISDLFSSFSDFSVFWENEKTADVSFLENSIKVKRYTNHPVKQLFPRDEISRFELGEILRWRCWDTHRENIEKYLYSMGLTDYDPYKICRKTHGVMFQDKLWLKFKGEDLCWEQVKCN